ncbi:hypothetical protein FKM82_025431 [Ascaphus truei]
MDRSARLQQTKSNKQSKTQEHMTSTEVSPLFITTYSRQANQIRTILKKHWDILKLDKDLDDYILDQPKIVFKKAKTIANKISPSLFDPNKNNFKSKVKGFFSCGDCRMCRHATPIKHILNVNTKRTHTLNSLMTCNTKFVIYLLRCTCGSSYVGRTIRPLRERIVEHVRTIRNKDVRYPVARHFSKCQSGSLQNFSFSALEHIRPHVCGGDRESLLNKREMFWIYALGTLAPGGMNLDWELKHFLD